MFTSVVMDGAEETLAWKMSLKSSTRNLYHHFTIYCGRLLSSIFNITWFEGESSSFTTSPAQWGWGGGGDHGKMQIIKHENMTVDLITWWMMILPRDASVERQTWRSQPRTLRCLATHPSQDWELGKLWFKSSNMEHGKVFWNTIKNVVYIDSYFAYIHDNIKSVSIVVGVCQSVSGVASVSVKCWVQTLLRLDNWEGKHTYNCHHHVTSCRVPFDLCKLTQMWNSRCPRAALVWALLANIPV